MTVKQFFSIIGGITFLYGFVLLALPERIGEAHGISSLSDFNILTLRMLGIAFVATGIMYWLAMPARLSYGRRAILAYTLLLDGLLVFLYLFEFTMKGGFVAMHYVDWVITLFTAIGAGFFLSKEKDIKF